MSNVYVWGLFKHPKMNVSIMDTLRIMAEPH